MNRLSQRTFVGTPDYDGDNGGTVIVLDPTQADNPDLVAAKLEPRLDLRDHSPTGFAWGYGGSGPAQLSLAILAEVIQDDDAALDLYQQFKEVIARLPKSTWSISEEYVRGWIEAMLARPLQLDGDPPPDYVHEPAEIVAGGEELDPMLVLELVRNGYSDLRLVPKFGVCGIIRMMYTTGVCYGLTETGIKGRWCFDSMQNAQLFLRDFDGYALPVVGEDGCTALK